MVVYQYNMNNNLQAVEHCCQELNKRLDPVREKMDSPTWQELIQSAYTDQVDLNVTYM